MSHNEREFQGCRYNPLSKDFNTKYQSLFSIVPAEYTGNHEKLLKYICLMYDPKSPLITDTASIDTRKKIAAQYAGIEINEYTEKAIFELEDEFVIEAIDAFLKEHIHERLFYMIMGNEQTFYEYGKRLLQPVTNTIGKGEKDLLQAIAIKSKLSEDMAAINLRLENDYRRLYQDDTQLQKAVSKKRFTPEAQASK